MDQDAEQVLSVEGLKVFFELDEGLVRAVDGVSFSVDQGGVVALVGESGCGKTVTVRAMLHLLDSPGRIVEGRVLFRGDGSGGAEDLAGLDPDGPRMRKIRGGEISLIFQEPMASFSPCSAITDAKCASWCWIRWRVAPNRTASSRATWPVRNPG